MQPMPIATANPNAYAKNPTPSIRRKRFTIAVSILNPFNKRKIFASYVANECIAACCIVLG
jgi:hypothetical protein